MTVRRECFVGGESSLRAVIFDLDGVISDTARVHAVAWKRMFDRFLQERGYLLAGQPEFDIERDYRVFVDGKARPEGIVSFLASRNIELPLGKPDDTGFGTVWGLGNFKNTAFREALEYEGVTLFEDAVQAIRLLYSRRIPLAVASSSKNCRYVLERVGMDSMFVAVVDGVFIQEHGLRSKPHPDIFLETADRLGIVPQQTMIVEDAPSGIVAAHSAKAGVVLAVDRAAKDSGELEKCGADIVVRNLDGLAEIFAGDFRMKVGSR